MLAIVVQSCQTMQGVQISSSEYKLALCADDVDLVFVCCKIRFVLSKSLNMLLERFWFISGYKADGSTSGLMKFHVSIMMKQQINSNKQCCAAE